MTPTSMEQESHIDDGTCTPSEVEGGDRGLGLVRGSATGVALAALMACNLLNYIDRNLLAGAQPVLMKHFNTRDSSMGMVSSLFFIGYMFGGPLLGWLGDRYSRRVLILLAVSCWSIMLGVATLGGSLRWFTFAYMMVGVAEAAFGVYGVSMLSDYYPDARRAKALSVYILCMNGGRALGIPLGGWLAHTLGWQSPFLVMTIVGVVVVLVAGSQLKEPPPLSKAHGTAGGFEWRQLSALFKRSYLSVTLGLAMVNFVSGGLAVWLPTYMFRYAGYSVVHAAAMLGVITLVYGLSGTWIGGVLGAWLLTKDRRALYWISAACLLLSMPCVLAILSGPPKVVLFGVMGAQFFLFLNMAPINTALLNAVPAAIRSTGIAFALILIHAFGDAVSPHLIGKISDAVGLKAGLSVCLLALAAGVVVLLYGAQGLKERGEDLSHTRL